MSEQMTVEEASEKLHSELTMAGHEWFFVGIGVSDAFNPKIYINLQKKSKVISKLNNTFYEGFLVEVKFIGKIQLL